MNPCFFLLGSETNKMEFHYRTPGQTQSPFEFEKIPYIPDRFETSSNPGRFYFDYNLKFIKTSLQNPSIMSKLFPHDQELVLKAKNDLISNCLIVPSLFLIGSNYIRRELLRSKFPPKFAQKSTYPLAIVGFSSIFAIINFKNILSQKNLFLTGKIQTIYCSL